MKYIIILALLLSGCAVDPIEITVIQTATPTPTPIATAVVE